MLRKSMLALAAVAALGLTTTASTDAFAKKGGWHKGGGWHLKHKGGKFKHYGHGFRFHVPIVYGPDCVKIRRHGRTRLVCYY